MGAIGLILPVLTGMVLWLTIVAAIGLGVVMLSAVVFHAARKEYGELDLTIALLLLCALCGCRSCHLGVASLDCTPT